MSRGLRQRQPRLVCPAFLAFVRRQRCCVCGAPAPSQAAHIRMACLERGKSSTGMAQKPDDRFATPLCQSCHLDGPSAQHRVGEEAFWLNAGIAPFALAASLWEKFSASPEFVEPRVRKPHKSKPKARRMRLPRMIPIPTASTFSKPVRAWPKRKFPAGRGFGAKR